MEHRFKEKRTIKLSDLMEEAKFRLRQKQLIPSDSNIRMELVDWEIEIEGYNLKLKLNHNEH